MNVLVGSRLLGVRREREKEKERRGGWGCRQEVVVDGREMENFF
jgi:hypothetical protein